MFGEERTLVTVPWKCNPKDSVTGILHSGSTWKVT